MGTSASCVVVLDVGKTNTKLSLWDRTGRLIERRTRPNDVVQSVEYLALDLDGIEAWIVEVLSEFARLAPVDAVIPITHGAAAVLILEDQVFTPPMDYEDKAPGKDRQAYDVARDPFAATGSPRLPGGLNLGAQLHWLEGLTGPWPDRLTILTWPQFWSWRLCGVASSEITSLGVHTDLWRPMEGRFSDLAQTRGWADRFPQMRRAGEVLGTLSPDWVRKTGLAAGCRIACGIHDSNAALVAARRRPEMSGGEGVTLSTGTWFVALRSMRAGEALDMTRLDEGRDCLVNVDVAGRPVPSARFMGGREAELIAGRDDPAAAYDAPALVARVPALLAERAMVLPSLSPRVGPFPHAKARFYGDLAEWIDRRTALELYLALVADESLDLIGAKGPILVEGRFAQAEVFIRALATFRPNQPVHVVPADDDLAVGALDLLGVELAAPEPLATAPELGVTLDAYRDLWRRRIAENRAGHD